MSQYVRKIDGIAAANDVIDILTAVLPTDLHNDSPCFIGLVYWVHTPSTDPSPGAFTIDIAYQDPTGAEVVLPGPVLNLQDASGRVSLPVEIIERLSTTSTFELRLVVGGVAADALISYRLMFTNPEGNDTIFFNN